MSDNFNDFLDKRIDDLINKKDKLECSNEKLKDDNYNISMKLEEFNKKVSKRKKFHLLFGFMGTVVLNIIGIKTIAALNVDLSKFGVLFFSLIESTPLIFGIHNFLNCNSEVEKEMNFDFILLNSMYDLNESKIKENNKTLTTINTKLNEASYLKQVSDLYSSGSLDHIIEEEKNNLKEKTLVLK